MKRLSPTQLGVLEALENRAMGLDELRRATGRRVTVATISRLDRFRLIRFIGSTAGWPVFGLTLGGARYLQDLRR